jgi:hypothetical protein
MSSIPSTTFCVFFTFFLFSGKYFFFFLFTFLRKKKLQERTLPILDPKEIDNEDVKSFTIYSKIRLRFFFFFFFELIACAIINSKSPKSYILRNEG